MRCESLELVCRPPGRALKIASPLSGDFSLGPLTAGLVVDQRKLDVTTRRADLVGQGSDGYKLRLVTDFGPKRISISQQFSVVAPRAIILHTELANDSGADIHLDEIELLGTDPSSEAEICLSKDPGSVRIYEQGNYWANVRYLGKGVESRHGSSLCWLSFDLASRLAFCASFLTEERWHGRIRTVEPEGAQPSSWVAGFDGGGMLIDDGQTVGLEDMLLLAGDDPWGLLEAYADLVGKRGSIQVLEESPVSWCSWYPYRLGVTDERILANARIAANRLKPLGLSIIEVDLGWERNKLPAVFEENDQFPRGLRWLADQLGDLGFRLGVWKAPFSISELDPLFREHPDWLLGGDGEDILARGEWFWEPHGKVYALDLTHPGAQEWLRSRIRSLAQRGVRYLKTDFLGQAMDSSLRRRHDPRIVAGGGTEASRIGLEIMLEEMRAQDPDALLLNCSGPEMPGRGSFPLLYVCNDTGNTGYVGWDHHRRNYGLNLAGHLYKHRRWGIIQPSCLCVGLPGTLEEARLRATATFLSGGQVDISDDLTTLPEERFRILFATLPPLGVAAKPVDLFEPMTGTPWRYEAMARGEEAMGETSKLEGSRVWHLKVSTDWDSWHLIGIFSYESSPNEEGRPAISSFSVPLARVGLDPSADYWAYEFWSGQFLGVIPTERSSPKDYMHPGDAQVPVVSKDHETLDVSFFGPAVKLLVIRPIRSHPWVVGTSFHQSGGTELVSVVWQDGILRGGLLRPAGHEGYITIAGGQFPPSEAVVAGQSVPTRPGAHGALVLPILASGGTTRWEVSFCTKWCLKTCPSAQSS